MGKCSGLLVFGLNLSGVVARTPLTTTRLVANGGEYSLITLQLNIEIFLSPLVLTIENQAVTVLGWFLEGVPWGRFQAVSTTIIRTLL